MEQVLKRCGEVGNVGELAKLDKKVEQYGVEVHSWCERVNRLQIHKHCMYTIKCSKGEGGLGEISIMRDVEMSNDTLECSTTLDISHPCPLFAQL